MAIFLNTDFHFHEGELYLIKQMNVPDRDNPTVPTLSPQLANHLQIAPLISIGTVDSEGRPWTTLWGGSKGMAQPLGNEIIGIKTPVIARFDPVVEELVGKEATGEVVREQGKGRMVSGLTLDLETRKRVKLYGRMVAGVLGMRGDEVTGYDEQIGIQLVLKIEQSLGNCPKYLNKKAIVPAISEPELVSESIKLPQEAVELIEKCDLFFVSSAQHDEDMDTNHRGGPQGFLRVASNDESGAVLVWPEYSGNRLYQTLGNLIINPKAGLCVPDFETGDMLYLTGTTEVLVGKDAAAYLPKSNLCVKVTATAARFVKSALPFRGAVGDRSPYNPVVRYLASEKAAPQAASTQLQQATLLSQTQLTPKVSRFRFSLQNPATYKPGQYVTLDFSEHLDMGYSHMRDSDPRSLNDDFVRSFTVSSPPGDPPNPVRNLKDDEFEITIRKVGTVTDFLFKHGLENSRNRMQLEVGVKGFSGEFEVQQEKDGPIICYIAAGVGITPLLPSLGRLEYERLRLLWSVREEDLGIVKDLLAQHPDLQKSLTVFVTNAQSDFNVQQLRGDEVSVELRRLKKEDLEFGDEVKKYYLCAAPPMRKQLIEWLPGKELVYEDFDF